MGNKLISKVLARDVAAALSLPLQGSNILIDKIVSLHAAENGGMCFSKKPLISDINGMLVIAPECELPVTQGGGVIHCKNPRLAFSRALMWLSETSGFVELTEPAFIHPTAKVSPHAFMGAGVYVGAGTVIDHFVVLAAGVTVGMNCKIKSGAVIGEDGFGFERDEEGVPQRIKHLGSVIIGDNVEIGSLTTVCRGTIEDTVIENNVKIDDHVVVAHNCLIRCGALVTGGVKLCGGVVVGAYSWIGPNTSIRQHVLIGDHAFIGIGSTVINNVKAGTKVFGNPAMRLDL
jgi:UDP-3-O-[3-hydroxymyristoyl] glucosamine N-acyltransferase